MDESEKLFESKIEEFLISEEGGWEKADDSGYCNHDYRGMALDIVTLTNFVRITQPMAWRRFERMCTIDPVRQFYKAFDRHKNLSFFAFRLRELKFMQDGDVGLIQGMASKIGAYDLCPCGSGQKFKFCHKKK